MYENQKRILDSAKSLCITHSFTKKLKFLINFAVIHLKISEEKTNYQYSLDTRASCIQHDIS